MLAAKPGPAKAANFFVSYTGCDEPFAKWVAWELGRAGFTYRLQAEHFSPGSRFINEMKDWLQNSEQVVAIISPEYFNSSYGTLEFNCAIAEDPLGKARRVIPVRIKEFQMPAMFRDLVYIDFVGKSEREARRSLIAGVRAARVGMPGKQQQLRKRVHFPNTSSSQPADSAEHPAPASRNDRVRIQYLACNTGRGLNFKKQYKLISDALRKSRHAKQLKLKAEYDVTDSNIFDKLNAYLPNIVHISGNQNGGDVLLPSSGGREVVVPDDALAGLLSSLGQDVRLAIIDTCKSYNCAKRVAEVVDCAIGVGEDIYDDEATRFYQIFYQALGAGRSIADAHSQARTALKFQHIPERRIPKLCVNSRRDASRLFLVN
jgi:hypothetical protein